MAYKNTADQKAYARQYYLRNRQKILERTRDRKKSNRKKWNDFKQTLSCTFCGASHPAIIDFHHTKKTPKNRKVSTLVSKGLYSAAFKEVKKCIPLCSNCHRIYHYNEHHGNKTLKKGATEVAPNSHREDGL